mmetsp:Transcript_54916/g.128393  ORF Transcript_54916/g.128393 Transcript_54916/m.128393 type:complete len:190 (+) Transcript_54916:462-1031(+)
MRSEGSVPCIPACQHPPTRLLASPDARLRLARACDAVMLLLREPGGEARATVRASEQRKSEGAAEASELRLEVYWKGEPGARRRRRRVDAPARTPREDARRRAAAAAAAGTHVTTHVRPWALCCAERCGAAVGSGWERLKGGRDDVQADYMKSTPASSSEPYSLSLSLPHASLSSRGASYSGAAGRGQG